MITSDARVVRVVAQAPIWSRPGIGTWGRSSDVIGHSKFQPEEASK